MHFDHLDLENLKTAAKDKDDDLYRNLGNLIEPQWVCTWCPPRKKKCAGHVKLCQGSKMGLLAARKHGSEMALCGSSSEFIARRLPVNRYIFVDQERDQSACLSIPCKRIEADAPAPNHSCACAEESAALTLCHTCRTEYNDNHRNAARVEAAKDPKCIEFVMDDFGCSKTHIMKEDDKCCRKCQRDFETPYCHMDGLAPVHITDKPAQTLECLVCHGGVFGNVAVGAEGDGGYSRFGVGRHLDTYRPWIQIFQDIREPWDIDFDSRDSELGEWRRDMYLCQLMRGGSIGGSCL